MRFATIFGALAALGWALGATNALAATKISSIDFKVDGGASHVEIKADGPIAFDKQENPKDQQVILDLKDAELLKTASRPLDTSSFDSPVSLISPYSTGTVDKPSVRVVIQLRSQAPVAVASAGNSLSVSVTGGTPSGGTAAGGAPADNAAAAAPAAPAAAAASDPAAPAPAAAPASVPDRTADAQATAEKVLEDFKNNQDARRFQGKPVTIQVRDAEVTDVLRLIGEASGFNVVVSDDVKGKISLALVDVPWDQALDLVLRTKQLGAERNNNVLRVTTLSNLTKEKQEELQAKQAAQATAARITRIFPISYANITDLSGVLQKIVASNQSGIQSATQTVVQTDSRTNSIIVQDTSENMEKIRKVIELLDTQTPQILVEAKIVEANENFSRDLSGKFGTAFGSQPSFVSMNGANPVNQLVGDTNSPFPHGNDVSTASSGGASLGLSILPGSGRINALLTLAETESEVQVVSAPKTVVLNKESAKILQSTPVAVSTATTVPGVGPVQTVVVQQANLSLEVKPSVTNDGSVLMDLNVSRDTPFDLVTTQAVANRNLQTKVLVDSGSTLVIGGIYNVSTTKTSNGIPFLHKIPILGWLFGEDKSNTSRTELFIFITPRVLNEKEAGLT